MKIVGSIIIIILLAADAGAKDFQCRIANQRMAKNPPVSASDFNLIFDIEIFSESKKGLFANISSMGGCYFQGAKLLYNDGKTKEKLGFKVQLPLSNSETHTYIHVPGDGSEMFKYRKVATIVTDLKKEISSFDSLPDIFQVKSFTGEIGMGLTIFNIEENKFEGYLLEIAFQAERLPTGNIMELSMKDISLEEVKLK